MFDWPRINAYYGRYSQAIENARRSFSRPMTFAEKVLIAHVAERKAGAQPPVRGVDYVDFLPDRVAMQDATAQMALLQFAICGRKQVAVPSTVHCDHLILAETGAKEDLLRAEKESSEVFSFLQSTSTKYGIGFWKPGAGIIHQVVLENYAFPGGMMIGTDSHTPNAGGLGMVAIGVGGADAVDVMVGMPWELRWPKLIGVHLTGAMSGWTSPKDVILKLAGILTVKGGTGAIIEYFGEGCRSISCTGKGTICNMGAEIGATTSLFPYDLSMGRYLRATDRSAVAEAADGLAAELSADPEVEKDPSAYYDQVIEIDLSALEPHINGPYSPDRAWPLSQFAKAVHEQDWPEKIAVALIGSCTNSSYEDIGRAASIAQQALEHGIRAVSPLTITPGSEQVRATTDRDALLDTLTRAGGLILANACGPCIGQWARHDVAMGERNSIITSYNRNFSGRNDANPGTHAFVASPEIVVAFSLAGRLTFNPTKDSLIDERGKSFMLQPPKGEELPQEGFVGTCYGFEAPAADGSAVEVAISEQSQRLQSLEPFSPPASSDFSELRILMKASGKCTTDHISPAGKWLKFRGHLDNISNNLFIGAVNSFRDEIGKGKNLLNGAIAPYAAIARHYKRQKIGWVAIGDENYGEGSSREHAAMEPRHLGGRAVIAKSFARIHETNLKKQGILAATFSNSEDYQKIGEEDLLSIAIEDFSPGVPLRMELLHPDGSKETILLQHTYTDHQIEWLKAGSALNLIRSKHQ